MVQGRALQQSTVTTASLPSSSLRSTSIRTKQGSFRRHPRLSSRSHRAEALHQSKARVSNRAIAVGRTKQGLQVRRGWRHLCDRSQSFTTIISDVQVQPCICISHDRWLRLQANSVPRPHSVERGRSATEPPGIDLDKQTGRVWLDTFDVGASAGIRTLKVGTVDLDVSPYYLHNTYTIPALVLTLAPRRIRAIRNTLQNRRILGRGWRLEDPGAVTVNVR